MRWPQFLLSLINLAFAVYLLLLNVFFSEEIIPLYFLWSLVYLALATAISHLYMLYMSNKIDDWYDVESLRSISNLSIASLLINTTALVTFMTLDYYHNKTITFFKADNILKTTVIPVGAALICSLVLFTSSIKFKKYVTLCQSIDLQPTTRKNYQTTD